MPHRKRHSYFVRNRHGDLVMSVFTDVKTCKLSPFETDVTVVIGALATAIPRKRAADLLRQAHARRDYIIERTVETFDHSPFCNKYCTRQTS